MRFYLKKSPRDIPLQISTLAIKKSEVTLHFADCFLGMAGLIAVDVHKNKGVAFGLFIEEGLHRAQHLVFKVAV